MHLFYTPDIIGKQYTLSKEESAHCIRVLRLGKNDEVYLVDGKGGFFKACIEMPDSKACMLDILETTCNYGKRPYNLTIAIGLIKQTDRFEWFVEKAVEIGIDVIIPLVCHRSEKKQVNTERLERIVISAIKQSVKAYKPIVRPVLTFNEFIDQPVQGCKYIAHCFGENRSLLSNACLPGRDATILIGPEGDFTEAEVSKAIEASYVPVSLGSSRLRTETAAVVACTTISIINDNNY